MKIDMSSVLLVDNDRVQQLAISKMLFLSGLNVIVANDGIEALEKIHCYCPTLVILDIVLPKMNGYDVCRRIKKNKETQSTPVIMFTAKSQDFDFYWGSKQGADAYVSKLCHPQLLIDTVNQLLQPLRIMSRAKDTERRSA
jgi:twitching motility two-component system response regulator PilH